MGSAIAGYFRDRGNEALESNRQIQEMLNQSLALRNLKLNENANNGKDTLSVSQMAKREAYHDKIQEMIDKGESLKSISFEDFQIFCRDRYNMPIDKQIYDTLQNASNTREEFDILLRELLVRWKNSGYMTTNWTQNDTDNTPVSYATYAKNASLLFR
jgi:hypothetical protein